MVLLSRIRHAVLVAWLSASVGFVALHLVPGNPVDLMIERGGRDAASRALLRARYGVDQPIVVQYGRYLLRVVRGDFGVSLVSGAPVAPAVRQAAGRTLLLSGMGAAGALLIGVPIGAAVAWRPRARWLHAVHRVLLVSYAIPEFLLALGCVSLLALRWRWFPVGGVEDPLIALTGDRWALWRDRLHHLALPAATLTLGWSAAFARQQRAAVDSHLRTRAVQVARAKGVGGALLFWRHLLRATLATPALVVVVLAPTLVSGALVVETVFAWPGMGTLMVRAIQGRDYPMASAGMMVTGVLVAGVSLAMTLLAQRLDPRTRGRDTGWAVDAA